MKQDIVGGIGILTVVAGVAFFSRPIALIVLGLFLIVWAFGMAATAAKKRN